MSSNLAEPQGDVSTATSCPVCHSLILEYDGENRGVEILTSKLKASAKSTDACGSCTFLWQIVCTAARDETESIGKKKLKLKIRPPPGWKGPILEKAREETAVPDAVFKTILVESKPPKHPGPMVVHFYPESSEHTYGEKTFQLYIAEDDTPSPWDLIGRGYHIPEDGLSPSCVALARQWLNSCVNAEGKHAKCAKATQSTLPRRVISVGDDTTSPRLVITKPDERAYYAALSHCWGGSTPTKTTVANLEAYTVSLPEDLPKTFVDAIKVARALEIPYIWIDSLCIIQDSPEDWEHEAARMAQVYSNAYVTIFSDAAPDSTTGFLNSPSREPPKRYTVPYKTDMSGPGVFHMRRRGFLVQELPFHSLGDKNIGSGQSKLSTRGWVFQERLLSPRTLHFAKNEMAWECRSTCECECSATSLRTLRTTSVMKHFLYPQVPDVSLAETTWRTEIVPAYSRLDFTFAKDRLPAIQGLAAAAHRLRSDDQYIAGLWQKTMKADLLWHMYIAGGDLPCDRIKDGGAPTWSWASIDGEVYYSDYPTPEDSELAILDILISKGKAPALLLRGHLVKVEFKPHDMSTVLLGPDDELQVVWDEERDLEAFKQISKYFLVFGGNADGPFGLLLAADTSSPSNNQFQRIGFIPGYGVSRWRRSWDSGGWYDYEKGVQSSESTGAYSPSGGSEDGNSGYRGKVLGKVREYKEKLSSLLSRKGRATSSSSPSSSPRPSRASSTEGSDHRADDRGEASSEESSEDEASGGIWEDANRDGAREWVNEIFQGEATTFRLI
ncbi:hypothetical protein F53441_3702 [Fusarium austroafricanum]|uniref:Heterokaryon incompatibility domain-containing protein n=1 Tax=Fusarium austroafricanum TaxID=2364996 RepID=A0A8H4P1J1_9HYPO|nr:hypothetical protein F53441_3702 [Fusarium austroafricanum]